MRWTILQVLFLLSLPCLFSGCLLAVLAGGAAEAGYVAGKKQSAGQTLTDQRITSSIKTKLIAHPEIAALKINVDTDGGVVTLRGTVNSAKQREMAIKIARTTKGVKKVIDKLEIIK